MKSSELHKLQETITEKLPFPIGNFYTAMLAADEYKEKARLLIALFEYLLKLSTILLISQYLRLDKDKISDPNINHLLGSRLSRAPLGTWVELLFALSKQYYDHTEINPFVPEFRDFYSKHGTQRKYFGNIIEIRNSFVHGKLTENDEDWKSIYEHLHEIMLDIFDGLIFISNYKLQILVGIHKINPNHRIINPSNRITSFEVYENMPNILVDSSIYLRNKKNELLELSPFVIGIQIDSEIVDYMILDSWGESSVNYISYIMGYSVRIDKEEFLAKLDIFPQDKSVRKLKIFISYAKQDDEYASQVQEYFSSMGHETWIDKINLIPGQDWEYEISKAIDESDFFVACLSNNSVSKVGFVQKELKRALSVLEKFPEGRIFIIPIRFDNCNIPSQVAKYHYVDWFSSNAKEQLRKTVRQ